MPSEMDTVRNSYRLAPGDKTVCKEMIALLENRKDAVSLAYLGAFRSIWAKHTPNPLSKLGTFRKGKKNIEAAVAAEPLNIEIRFVRLSVQLNAPGFLGYNDDIDEDKKFIMANRGTITSEVLKSMVDDIIE
ncbi:hypothetical protein HYN59_11335 [Flavobacterium album]|uniref:Uncharacterized protein n=2 Tax=Flavobacterium album TaxID=2175091 RepID=A0A2S1QZ19_9FLAO|nr:hypothetical protein HYN59_11335 [Flavobacterium album]